MWIVDEILLLWLARTFLGCPSATNATIPVDAAGAGSQDRDVVVHEEHGVAILRAIETTVVEGVEFDPRGLSITGRLDHRSDEGFWPPL